MKKLTADDAPSHFIRVHQRKKDQWILVGFKCPDCNHFYKGMRAELFRHENICKGKITRSLEE